MLGMFHERYLVNLPRLKRDKTEWCDTSSRRLRWLWCSWVSKLLGWKESRPEGHPNGLSAEVYTALREKKIPIPKVERDEVEKARKQAATVQAQGGSSSHGPGCCIHCTAGTFGCPGSPGKSSKHTPEHGSCMSISAGAGSKHLDPGSEPDGPTRRAWIKGMQQQGYLDESNVIVWSANPSLGLPSWSFKQLIAVMETSDASSAYSTNRDEGHPVNLGALASSSSAASGRIHSIPRFAGGYVVSGRGRPNTHRGVPWTVEEVFGRGSASSFKGEPA
jgi:hypothetical protein